MDAIEIKRIIREIRKRLGLSQGEFGDKLGVTQQAVQLWEKGTERNKPNDENLERIMEMYNALDQQEVFLLNDEPTHEETAVMVRSILASQSRINKVALVASVQALYKACQGEIEMDRMSSRMAGMEDKIDTLMEMMTALLPGFDKKRDATAGN